MELDPKVAEITKDIEDIEIQGATNVAEACVKGFKIFFETCKGGTDKGENFDLFMKDFELIGLKLVNARQTEPLARNALKFVLRQFKLKHPKCRDVTEAKKQLASLAEEFFAILKGAKKDIASVGAQELAKYDLVFTHCHSTTAERMIIAANEKNPKLEVVATETRPLYQGRTTAVNLEKAGVDVTLIVDSAAASFIADDKYMPVEAVVLGCDEIAVRGSCVNKIGSFSMALSAYYASKPLYIAATLLKLELATVYRETKIEMRKAREIWKDAPKELDIINPAFDMVPAELITGFITEAGIIKPDEVEDKAGELYEWMR